MKNIILVFIAISAIIFYSCSKDKDDELPTPTPTCNYSGLSYQLNNTTILAPEVNLQTEIFPNNSFDPITNQPIPAVEIYGNDANGDFIVFVTEVLTVNATGTAELSIGSGTNQIINVTCLANDNTVGGNMRYQISGIYNNQNLSGEYCVIIDAINP